MNPIENNLNDYLPDISPKKEPMDFKQSWQLLKKGYAWEGNKIKNEVR